MYVYIYIYIYIYIYTYTRVLLDIAPIIAHSLSLASCFPCFLISFDNLFDLVLVLLLTFLAFFFSNIYIYVYFYFFFFFTFLNLSKKTLAHPRFRNLFSHFERRNRIDRQRKQ